MLTEAERYFYDRGVYGSTALKVDLAMAHTDRPCVGGECDSAAPCERHRRTAQVVERLTRAVRARGADR